jgi:hypothetical protein
MLATEERYGALYGKALEKGLHRGVVGAVDVQ